MYVLLLTFFFNKTSIYDSILSRKTKYNINAHICMHTLGGRVSAHDQHGDCHLVVLVEVVSILVSVGVVVGDHVAGS